MRLQWPAYRAGLTSHTVDTGRGRAAGYLVRCTASGRELGYIWQTGSSWQWKAREGYGERSSLEAAVRQLRDVADVARPGATHRPAAGVQAAPRWGKPVPMARPKPNTWALDPDPDPAPAKPAPRIQWTDTTSVDLTAAIAAQLEKHKR